ncbi:TAXI family TRAP transporter solute-binding subunit [Oscillibacter hominis]|uniref:TAXI family TRAP transporter solute-binding subunit n=1 Tax=Oscillibacter hominis TaxID=2763056 RepID=A0A7G9B6Y0_9FIRM|nr:TAXI family TRAP transporter solute-binding subunit [Oscillibacter hominis]QNL45311.1 TAXI family TRAP transporter solute-binding subunit [Oscillibacter hominis]
MKKMLSLLLSGMLILSLLAGCGTASPPAPSGSSSGSSSAGGGLDIPDSYTLLNTASGSSGGLWYTLMVCYSEVLKNDTGISLQCEPGGGGTANMNAVGVDDHTFGFTNNAAMYCGMNGIGYDQKFDNVRTMFPLYPSIQLFYAVDPNLKTIYDLEDKIVCLGPSGGGVVNMTLQEFETFGIHPREVVYMAYADALTALKDGTIDCVVDAGGHPNASVTELETTMDRVSLLTVPVEDMEKIHEAAPYYSVFPISADLYKSLDEDLQMLGFYSIAICTEDFPDDVVYAMTKAAYDNYDTIVTNVASAKDIALENVQYMYGPMHPGAMRYYEEQGIDVSAFDPGNF